MNSLRKQVHHHHCIQGSATISETERLGWVFLQTVPLPTLKCLVQSKKNKHKLKSKSILSDFCAFKTLINTFTCKYTTRHNLRNQTMYAICLNSQCNIFVHLRFDLYPFLALQFGASSSLVQQLDARQQMKWTQAHRLAAHPPFLQQDLPELHAHPETRTNDISELLHCPTVSVGSVCQRLLVTDIELYRTLALLIIEL